MNKKDIERNIRRVNEGKSLDMPLRLFDSHMRKRLQSLGKKFVVNHGIRINAQRSFNSFKNKKYEADVEDKIQWCLWFMFYYNKYVSKK